MKKQLLLFVLFYFILTLQGQEYDNEKTNETETINLWVFTDNNIHNNWHFDEEPGYEGFIQPTCNDQGQLIQIDYKSKVQAVMTYQEADGYILYASDNFWDIWEGLEIINSKYYDDYEENEGYDYSEVDDDDDDDYDGDAESAYDDGNDDDGDDDDGDDDYYEDEEEDYDYFEELDLQVYWLTEEEFKLKLEELKITVSWQVVQVEDLSDQPEKWQTQVPCHAREEIQALLNDNFDQKSYFQQVILHYDFEGLNYDFFDGYYWQHWINYEGQYDYLWQGYRSGDEVIKSWELTQTQLDDAQAFQQSLIDNEVALDQLTFTLPHTLISQKKVYVVAKATRVVSDTETHSTQSYPQAVIKQEDSGLTVDDSLDFTITDKDNNEIEEAEYNSTITIRGNFDFNKIYVQVFSDYPEYHNAPWLLGEYSFFWTEDYYQWDTNIYDRHYVYNGSLPEFLQNYTSTIKQQYEEKKNKFFDEGKGPHFILSQVQDLFYKELVLHKTLEEFQEVLNVQSIDQINLPDISNYPDDEQEPWIDFYFEDDNSQLIQIIDDFLDQLNNGDDCRQIYESLLDSYLVNQDDYDLDLAKIDILKINIFMQLKCNPELGQKVKAQVENNEEYRWEFLPWEVVYENMLAKHNWYSELVALNDLALIKEEVQKQFNQIQHELLLIRQYIRWENSWYDIDMYGNEVDPYYEPEEGAKDPDEYQGDWKQNATNSTSPTAAKRRVIRLLASQTKAKKEEKSRILEKQKKRKLQYEKYDDYFEEFEDFEGFEDFEDFDYGEYEDYFWRRQWFLDDFLYYPILDHYGSETASNSFEYDLVLPTIIGSVEYLVQVYYEDLQGNLHTALKNIKVIGESFDTTQFERDHGFFAFMNRPPKTIISGDVPLEDFEQLMKDGEIDIESFESQITYDNKWKDKQIIEDDSNEEKPNKSDSKKDKDCFKDEDENYCSGNGECVESGNKYKCECNEGYKKYKLNDCFLSDEKAKQIYDKVAISIENSKKELKDFDSKTDEEKKQIKGLYIASLTSPVLQPDQIDDEVLDDLDQLMGHVESDEDAEKSINCIDNVMKTQKKKDVKKPEDQVKVAKIVRKLGQSLTKMVNEDERTKEFVSENIKISVSFVDNTQDFEFLANDMSNGESAVKVPQSLLSNVQSAIVTIMNSEDFESLKADGQTFEGSVIDISLQGESSSVQVQNADKPIQFTIMVTKDVDEDEYKFKVQYVMNIDEVTNELKDLGVKVISYDASTGKLTVETTHLTGFISSKEEYESQEEDDDQNTNGKLITFTLLIGIVFSMLI